jgi:hypothetical protein
MTSLVVWVLLAVLGLILKKAVEFLEKEYARWAPALARLLVRVAGFVYWPRRDEWEANLRYFQQLADGSGLPLAGSCLLSAPALLAVGLATLPMTALRVAARALRAMGRRSIGTALVGNEASQTRGPPWPAEKLLHLVLPPALSDPVIGDLAEGFCQIRGRHGPGYSGFWYWQHTLSVVSRFAGKKLAKLLSVG